MFSQDAILYDFIVFLKKDESSQKTDRRNIFLSMDPVNWADKCNNVTYRRHQVRNRKLFVAGTFYVIERWLTIYYSYIKNEVGIN